MPSIVQRIKKLITDIELSSFTAGMLFGALVYAGLSRYGAEAATSLNTIATVALAIVGIHGIKSWRSIYIEKKKHEAAESLIIDFSNAKSFFKHMTNPLIEYEEPKKDEQYEKNKIINHVNKLILRHQSGIECFRKIDSMQFYYECVLGKDAKNVCLGLIDLYTSYEQNIKEYSELSMQILRDKEIYGDNDVNSIPNAATLMQQDKEELKEVRKFLYKHPDSPLFKKVEELGVLAEKIKKANMMK